MGWITSTRTRTTSPGLTLLGTRIRNLPPFPAIAPPSLAAAAAHGDLDLAPGHQERPVGQLGDRAHVGALTQAEIGRHEGLPHGRRPGELDVERAGGGVP